jgi:hypothetical protein
MTTVTLKRFNIETITNESVVVVIGKRQTGKSLLFKDIMYRHRDIPCGTVISATESVVPFYNSFTPSIFIHYDAIPMESVVENVVKNVVKRQTNFKSIVESGMETNVVDARYILVLDDCVWDSKSWTKIKSILLTTSDRLNNMLFLMTMQYPLGILPDLRKSIDYVFIFRDNNISTRKRIFESYAAMFPSFEIFCSVMDQCTDNYECLVIIDTSSKTTNEFQDQVFYYKAELHEDFKMSFVLGIDDVWRLSAKRKRDE